MADKFGSFGAILELGDGADPQTAAWTPIANVADIGGPSESLDPVDVTTHDSPKGFREFVAGIADGGEVSFDLVYDEDEATHDESTGLISYLENRQMVAIRLTTTGTSKRTIAFAALVTGFESEHSVDGAQTASCTVKVSSYPVWGTVP